jgi:hypothetical protein
MHAEHDDTRILVGVALAPVLLHLATNGNYGIFRDELYYIACSDRLAWGYVDHPPLSIAILALTRRLVGDTVHAIRLPVALAGGVAVFLVGRLARDLGGGPTAQWMAALAYAVTATSLVFFGFFSMNAFDALLWIVTARIFARLLSTGDRRWWLAFGFTVGIGLLNKYSIGFFAFALVVALVLTPRRTLLSGPWPWVGAGIALALFAPHVLWETNNGFPTLEFIRNAQEKKIIAVSPLEYFGAQIVQTNPLLAPLWLIGLGSLLFSPGMRPHRVFGLAYLVLLTLFLLQNAKPYYLAPVYPLLLAAGGVALERVAISPRVLRPLVACWLIVAGAVVAPMSVPILAPENLVRYAAAIGIEPPREERGHAAELPQHFADRFGWENMAATVAHVYGTLPASERGTATILAGNYGQASAIDYFGPSRGLPPAISGHNNYWLWGYGGADGKLIIAVGLPRERLEEVCESVRQAATVMSPYALERETNLPVYVCRNLKIPMAEAWRMLKRYI